MRSSGWLVVVLWGLLGMAWGCEDSESDPVGGTTAPPAGGSGGTAGAGGSNTGGSNTGGSNTGGSNTGGSNTGGSNTGGSGGVAPTFELTSTAFADGASIPAVHTCDGANTSPQLAWTGAPPAAASYAVILGDLAFDPAFLHSAIWDIPAATSELPAAIEAAYQPSNVPGAVQCDAWDSSIGYSGPCPPSQHTYEFAVYALDVATLTEVDQSSSLSAVRTAVEAHALDVATLTGIYPP